MKKAIQWKSLFFSSRNWFHWPEERSQGTHQSTLRVSGYELSIYGGFYGESSGILLARHKTRVFEKPCRKCCSKSVWCWHGFCELLEIWKLAGSISKTMHLLSWLHQEFLQSKIPWHGDFKALQNGGKFALDFYSNCILIRNGIIIKSYNLCICRA